MTVREIFDSLKAWAPMEYALDFDNPGLLVGDEDAQADRVLVALDVTSDVIDEAERMGAKLIVSHHPLIFHKLGAVVEQDGVGRRVIRLIKSGISLISMHTNLDAAQGGVNDALAECLGVKNLSIIEELGDGYGIGRVGELDEAESVRAFLKRVKSALGAPGLRYAAADKMIKKVAVGGGACSSYLELVHAMGCDAFVTADVKHDGYLSAREMGITLIDAGHFSTENPICGRIKDYIESKLQGVEVSLSQACRAPEEYYTGE